ncbi:MAG TPA: maleylpyruvate isomerase family mycothiol-dependent enzyme [Acidimicrobiales bacterium]|nr:maleylpyruvate isomerase family mycothiol-dependent enzyme [Acidimicrobiales bacterium]
MALSKQEITSGLVNEATAFADLVESLTDEQLQTPSRCEGWTVGDVAAHAIGGLSDALSGNLDGAGTPEYTQRQVDERKGRSGAELAEELRTVGKAATEVLGAFDDDSWNARVPVGYDGTIGEGVEALWYDLYLHGEDIRAALGRPATRTEGLKASVSHLAFELQKRNWGPATLALTGLPEFQVGGGGRRIEGDAYEFVLAATGRIDPTTIGLDETVNVYRD